MIIEYYRPESLASAIQYVTRDQNPLLPLYGNTKILNSFKEPIGVVDLQLLDLNKIEHNGNQLLLGSMLTLQDVLGNKNIPPGLKKPILHEASLNLRNSTTLAEIILGASGRSPLGTALLALDTQVEVAPGNSLQTLSEIFILRLGGDIRKIIIHLIIPSNVHFSYAYISRTPADLPIVCVGVSKWPSGRTRVALGGYGKTPKLAMDGPTDVGAEKAAHNVYSEAGDQWASAKYRSELAAILTRRCLEKLT